MRHTLNQVKSQSNTSNETFDFKIGDAAVVIDILRNKLYSDKIRVVTQEIICNARDAMREVRNSSDQIEITLPTKKNPVFKVRDFGPGLSTERVQEVFVQFGRSTKRDNDEQTGGFGLGAKSPFCYTESFVIVSIHAGVETHYVAHLGKNAVGTLEKIHQGPTTAKAGVEIQIGVNLSSEGPDDDGLDDLARFHHGVYRTIAFWSTKEQPIVKNKADAYDNNWMDLRELVASKLGIFCDNVTVINRYDMRGYTPASMSFVVDGIIYDDNDDFDSTEREKLMNLFEYGTEAFLLVKSSDVEVAASREAVAVNQKNAQMFKLAFRQARAQVTTEVGNTISKVEKISQIQDALKHLSPLTSSARAITKSVEGISIDFQEGTLSTSDGYFCFDISGRSRRIRINEHEKPRLNGFFIYNDSDLAETTLKIKVKAMYQADNARKHFVIIPKEMSKAASLFKAIAVSSLRNPRASRAGMTRDQLPSGYVAFKTIVEDYRGSKVTSVTVDISNIPPEITYVVVPDTTDKTAMLGFGPMQELLGGAGGKFVFCFPTKTALKQIHGNKSFVDNDIFFTDLQARVGKDILKKVRATIQETLREEALDILPLALEVLLPLAKHIEDPIIAAGLASLKGPQKRTARRASGRVLTDTLVLEAFKADFASFQRLSLFSSHLKETYGSLLSGYIEDPMAIVYYINGKHGFMKKAVA